MEDVKQDDAAQAKPVRAVDALLAGSVPTVTAELGALSLEGLAELDIAEREGKSRAGVLSAIAAERTARLAGNPALALPASLIASVAVAAYNASNSKSMESLDADAREAIERGVAEVLADPAWDRDDPFSRGVHAMLPLAQQIHELTQGQAATRTTLPDGVAASPGVKAAAGKTADRIKAIALLSQGGTVEHTVELSGARFSFLGEKAILLDAILLPAELPAMSINEAAALDELGRVLGRCRWAVAMAAGGGREAYYPARSIAFDL